MELERAQAEGIKLPDDLKKIADDGKRRRSTMKSGALSKIFSGREDFDQKDEEKMEGKGKRGKKGKGGFTRYQSEDYSNNMNGMN